MRQRALDAQAESISEEKGTEAMNLKELVSESRIYKGLYWQTKIEKAPILEDFGVFLQFPDVDF